METGAPTGLQSVLTRLLEHFDAACRAAAVPFYLEGGTLLGAVRSRGWIPWDDDIDVLMWREDYEHLRKALEQQPDPQARLWDPLQESGSGVLARFTIIGSAQAVRDRAHLGHPERAGVCMDVYVIDTGPAHQWLVRPWLDLTRLLQAARLAKGCAPQRLNGWRPRRQQVALRAARIILRPLPESLIQRAYFIAATAFAGHADTGYTLNASRTSRRRPIPRAWFADRHPVTFVNREYRAPDPQAYLSAMYGADYLTPPPPESRVAHDVTAAYARLDECEVRFETDIGPTS